MRRCQRIGCENSLDHHRADARYCGPTCKREAARSANLSDGSAAPAFWDRYVLLRRSRRRRIAATTLLALLLALAGCGGHHKTSTCPQAASGHGAMGVCAPPAVKQKLNHPLLGARLKASSPLFEDLSNNDPCYCGPSMKANGRVGLIVKANQGTGFVDSTAVGMVNSARAAGLAVGEYDFDQDYTVAEAQVFVSRLHAAGIYGNTPNTFPAYLDVEYGSFNYGGLQAQINYLHSQGYRVGIYTGDWYWGPHAGCRWPAGLLSAWLSGYPNAPVPCATTNYNAHQFTDTPVDLSVFLGGFAGFPAFVAAGSPPDPYAIFQDVTYDLGHGIKANEKTIVKGWNDRNCFVPTKRPVCGFLHYRLVLLAGRIIAVANRSHPADYSTGHRFKRVRYIQAELAEKHVPRVQPPS